MQQAFDDLCYRIKQHLAFIYDDVPLDISLDDLTRALCASMRLTPVNMAEPEAHTNLWDENDVILITYGDSICRFTDLQTHETSESPLVTLQSFLTDKCKDAINNVHILPFFPYSSDDGFSVIDYSSVNQGLGSWEDVAAITDEFGLMADLVINHCSARSAWFQQFIEDKAPGNKMFATASLDDDLGAVVRPRTSPLLRETETHGGTKYVWCTFSHDQVDFNFKNPDVLIAFSDIIRLYLDKGTTIFRLDAIAFLWKEIGTSCINLKQTHEVVRLYRTLIEHAQADAIIITETNIPNRENLTYFGNANEAHGIYNFSLPPLLLNSLLTENCQHLKTWLMSMPPAQNGTFYFNFIASHDGIGLRPAEGLLDDNELQQLVDTVGKFGGKVSWRTGDNGQQKPYELNIALFDACRGTVKGEDTFQMDRFLCAHAIMFGLEGIPGLYIHSLLGTQNDHDKVTNTGHNRSINRHRWQYEKLEEALSNTSSHHYRVFEGIKRLLNIRKQQKAFHPNATQFTLQLGDKVFGYWRQSMDRKQSIFCISNITTKSMDIPLANINLIGTDAWRDLISGDMIELHQVNLHLTPYQTVWISNT